MDFKKYWTFCYSKMKKKFGILYSETLEFNAYSEFNSKITAIPNRILIFFDFFSHNSFSSSIRFGWSRFDFDLIRIKFESFSVYSSKRVESELFQFDRTKLIKIIRMHQINLILNVIKKDLVWSNRNRRKIEILKKFCFRFYRSNKLKILWYFHFKFLDLEYLISRILTKWIKYS